MFTLLLRYDYQTIAAADLTLGGERLSSSASGVNPGCRPIRSSQARDPHRLWRVAVHVERLFNGLLDNGRRIPSVVGIGPVTGPQCFAGGDALLNCHRALLLIP